MGSRNDMAHDRNHLSTLDYHPGARHPWANYLSRLSWLSATAALTVFLLGELCAGLLTGAAWWVNPLKMGSVLAAIFLGAGFVLAIFAIVKRAPARPFAILGLILNIFAAIWLTYTAVGASSNLWR
jgi:hypothetical protein